MVITTDGDKYEMEINRKVLHYKLRQKFIDV